VEEYILKEPINVLCVNAKSYPDGIAAAHDKLRSLIPIPGERKYFGLSRPEQGVIRYRAAIEELHDGEAEKFGCESFVIPDGRYVTLVIHNFFEETGKIKEAFDELIEVEGIDPYGYCVEWYLNENDLRCMVRLAS